KRFRDGHHLQDELKAMQRSLPSTPWDLQRTESAAIPAPPPPAPTTPGVVEWSRRAANFLRLTARAYPNTRPPDKVQQAADRMWELAAHASRLEGELASHSRKLEALERRGRALRAEIGRKVEELAQEESRTMREVTTERERAAEVAKVRAQAERDWATVRRRLETEGQQGLSAQVMRQLCEEVGASRARMETLGTF